MSVGERPGRAVALARKNRTEDEKSCRPGVAVPGRAPVGYEMTVWKKSHERVRRRLAFPRNVRFPRARPATRHSSGAPPRVAAGRPSASRDIAGTALEASNRRADARVARGTLGRLAETSAPARAVAASVACESVARASLGIGVRDRSNAAMPTSDAPVPPELVITAAELAHVTVRRARATPRPSDRARERVRCSLFVTARVSRHPARPTPTLTLPPPNPSPPRPPAGERPRPHGDMVRPVPDRRSALVARGSGSPLRPRVSPPRDARFPTNLHDAPSPGYPDAI